MSATGSPDPSIPPTAQDRLARSWAAVTAGTSYVPMDIAELTEHLRPFVGRLLDLLRAGTELDPVAGPAAEVGRALVAAHFTSTETLNRTLVLLGNALPDYPGGSDRAVRTALLSGLATGYASGLRDRTLDEQEAIRKAAMTAQARAEQALRDTEARFHAVFTGAATGIALGDLTGHIIESNAALATMLGQSPEQLRGRDVFDIVHPDDVAELREQIYQRVAQGAAERVLTELRFVREDGQVLWGLLAVSVVRDSEGRPSYLVAMGEDNTRRHELRDRLTYRATRDSLTGLANRTLFTDRLHQAFARAAPTTRLGLCFLDLDGFKIINDSLGHDIGDRLLQVVADRLATAVTSDHVVARLGGDEFVILVTESTGERQLIELAERVLAALIPPVALAGHELSVSASIGIVERAIFGSDPAEVMRAADITLYWAKSAGKNRWATFDAERDAQEAARYQLSEAMPEALVNGEFTVAYQPMMTLADDHLGGVETQVRWRHPRFGLLGPEEFLGVAEETGLAVPLGRWVLRAACRQGRDWLDRYGRTPLISVNLSVRQVRDEGLADDVCRVLRETGLPADRLQLELTEHALMDADPLAALRSLVALGVRIIIDDFGTGYSNLAHLRRAPVQGIKLAPSFTGSFDAPEHPDRVDLVIVRTLVSLAHTLGLTVSAGGLKTRRQRDRLHTLGCEWGQGWLFGPPTEPEEIDQLLDAAPTDHR